MADYEIKKRQLQDIISSMKDEGMVDNRLSMAYEMKQTADTPFFFVQLVSTFCSDAQTTLRDMSRVLNQHPVDFHELEEFCLKIKGGASCIGACRMALRCQEFRTVGQERSRERSIIALNAIQHEFSMLETKMNIIVELEKKIVGFENYQ